MSEASVSSSGSVKVSNGVNILKSESTYSNRNSNNTTNSSKASTNTKKIQFADDIGEQLAENNYVEELHYSPSSYGQSEAQHMGCNCIISWDRDNR